MKLFKSSWSFFVFFKSESPFQTKYQLFQCGYQRKIAYPLWVIHGSRVPSRLVNCMCECMHACISHALTQQALHKQCTVH